MLNIRAMSSPSIVSDRDLPARHGVQTALQRSATAAAQAHTDEKDVRPVDRFKARLKSVAALGVTAATTPLPLALSTLAAAKGLLRAPASLPHHGERRTALVMGVHMSKGLHLCRHLHAAGFHVIGADLPAYSMAAARLSSALDEFVTLPAWYPAPEVAQAAVHKLVRERSVSLVLSSAAPNHSIYDALIRTQLPAGTHSLAVAPELMAQLDDKLEFTRLCQRLGLAVPNAEEVLSLDDALRLNASGTPYVLKSVVYNSLSRAAQVFLPMPPAELRRRLQDVPLHRGMPWVAQERLGGNEYSTYAIARRGQVIAYADTRAQLSNLRYQHLGDARLEAWVRQLCAGTQLDGQVCVDFMEDAAGQVRAIECNPRASSVLTCFAQQPDFVNALADPDTCTTCIYPRSETPTQYWLMHELFEGLTLAAPVSALPGLLTQGHDALLSSDDPWPLLGMHAMQIPSMLVRCAWRGTPWSKVDVNIGKLAQVGGD